MGSVSQEQGGGGGEGEAAVEGGSGRESFMGQARG